MCSAFLFSFCPDLDIAEIKNDLRNTDRSQQGYIETLKSSGNWIIGTIQPNLHKPTAEIEAYNALSRSIRIHVNEEINREINGIMNNYCWDIIIA